MVGKRHPSLYSLTVQLRKEQEDASQMIIELRAGRRIRENQKTKYTKVNIQLQNTAQRYAEYKQEGRILEYLRTCGHNFTL